MNNNIASKDIIRNNVIQLMLYILSKDILYRKKQNLEAILNNMPKYDYIAVIVNGMFYKYNIKPDILQLDIDNTYMLYTHIILNQNVKVGTIFQTNLYEYIDLHILDNLTELLERKNIPLNKLSPQYLFGIYKRDDTINSILKRWVMNAKNKILNNVYNTFKDVDLKQPLEINSSNNGNIGIVLYSEKILVSKKNDIKSIYYLVIDSLVSFIRETISQGDILVEGEEFIPMGEGKKLYKPVEYEKKEKIYLKGKIKPLRGDINDYLPYVKVDKLHRRYLAITKQNISYNVFFVLIKEMLNYLKETAKLEDNKKENIIKLKEENGYVIISIYDSLNNFSCLSEKVEHIIGYIMFVLPRLYEIPMIYDIKSLTKDNIIYIVQYNINNEDIAQCNIDNNRDNNRNIKRDFKNWKCDCPDFEYRGRKKGKCKHLIMLDNNYTFLTKKKYKILA